MDAIRVVVGILAVWRITHLLAEEKGPWDLILRLRRRAGTGVLGKLMDCFNCLSLWIALPAAWLTGRGLVAQLLLWPALSGGAILLQRATTRTPPAIYYEDEERADELLRKE